MTYKFLDGGGEMGELTRSYTWEQTSLGSPDKWPQSLRTTLSILLNSKFPMFLFWGPEQICFYNDAYRPSLGNEGKHPAIGKKGKEVWPEIWETIKPLMDQVLQNGEATWSEDQLIPIYRNNSLEDVYWTFSYSPVNDETGGVAGVFVTCMETTDKVTNFRKVVESEHRFRNLIEEAPIPMCLYVGRELKIEIVNEALLATWGRDKSVIGKFLKDALPELAGQPFLQLLDEVYTTGISYSIKNAEAKVKRGEILDTVYYDLWYNPVFDADGKVYGVLATGADTTEKVFVQKKIEESEKNLRNVILQAPVAMCIFKGPDHVVEIANERMYELWGKSAPEVLARPIFEGLPEVRNQGFEDLLSNVYNTGETYKAYGVPVTLPRKNGVETIYTDFLYEALRETDNNISGVMAVAIDVTEQVLSKQNLQLSEERLRIAVEAAGLGTFEIDFSSPDEMITTARFDEIFGVDHHVSRHEYAAIIHPDDMAVRNNAHEGSLHTGRLFYEVRLLKKDNRVDWIRVAGKVLYDKQGNPEKLLGILQDITEQKNLQQQKDNFIGVASHELKTPVTTIKAYAQVLEKILINKGDIKEAEMIGRMDTQVNRLTNLITDLLDVTKLNSGKLELNRSTFDLNQLVAEMTEELQRTTDKHALHVHFEKPVEIFADKERISQVIINFISNAIKYSPDANVINISTTNHDDKVTFCVQDFGIGITEENCEKVFEQFYRVTGDKRHTFQGLGLGLYISSEIIKREGGKIWVDSTQGKGSAFYFSLPLN